MKKLYKEFFYIPKHQKIREKVMITRAIMVVAFIVMCLMAMSFTAYAHFTCNVSSVSNSIESANFEANVIINNGEPTTTKSGKTQTVDLPAGEYQIVIKKGDCSAKTGFCIITINDTPYYTSQIGVDLNKNLTDASVEFALKVSADTKIEIFSHWGTSSCYGYNNDTDSNEFYIKNDDFIDLTVSLTNDKEESLNEEVEATESTTSSETNSSETTTSSEQSSEIEPSSTEESSTTESGEETSSSENTEATSTDISLTSE